MKMWVVLVVNTWLLHLAARALAGELEDFTGGATFYHTKNIRPYWSLHKSPCYETGNHLFYNDIK